VGDDERLSGIASERLAITPDRSPVSQDDAEGTRAEGSHDRDVGGIATACHQDAADPRLVVAGIQRVPAVAEIDFVPSAEIHRCRVRRHADVAEIAGAITRRNVHAAE
jgi:hypothetical protein